MHHYLFLFAFMDNVITVALAGNPNAGKTSLFNHLTGAAQSVGNYPGVTVERKEGVARLNGRRVEKASAAVRAGDVLTLPLGEEVRVIRLRTLPARRGPASEAQACYEQI